LRRWIDALGESALRHREAGQQNSSRESGSGCFGFQSVTP